MPDRPEFDGLDPELIGRYLANEVSDDERTLVRRWLMAHPEAAERLRLYLAQLDDEAVRPPTPNVDAEWGRLQARIHAHVVWAILHGVVSTIIATRLDTRIDQAAYVDSSIQFAVDSIRRMEPAAV